MNARNDRAQARAVLGEAQSSRVSLDDLHRNWPEEGDPLIDAIFDEAEDTVEHQPGSLLRPGATEERFRRSAAYKLLVIDAELLGDDFADVASDRLLEMRARFLQDVDLGLDDAALRTSARDFVAKEAPDRLV